MPMLQADAAEAARSISVAESRKGASARPLPADGPVIATTSARGKVADAPRGRPSSAAASSTGMKSKTNNTKVGGNGGGGGTKTAGAKVVAAKQTARPSTATSSSRTGAKHGRAVGLEELQAAAAATSAADETYTVKQLRLLEAEMSHLRATIDVLLESRGVPAGENGPITSSGLLVGGATLSTPAVDDERASLAVARHEEHLSLGLVSSTLNDKHRHDRRVAALRKESALLSNPKTMADASRADYTRDPLSMLMGRVAAAEPTPFILPNAVDLDAAEPPQRRPSFNKTKNTSRASASGSASVVGGGGGSRAGSRASSRANSPTGSPANKVKEFTNAAMTTTAAEPAALILLERTHMPAASPAARPASAPHAHFEHLSATEMKARKLASEQAVALPAGLAGRRSASTNAAPLSKAELDAKYSGLPGLKKATVATTSLKGFAFAGHAPGMSIRESNVWRMVEEKRAKEAEALKWKFTAQRIAPATADIGLFARIMAKNEERRRIEHDRKAAYAAAHFKPFTIVTAHCDEAAARLAAKRAEADLALQRELAASRVFTPNPVPASTSNPDSMFFRILQREADRGERTSAAARALAATSSLPPRMASGVVEDARKAAAKLAEREAAEKAEQLNATFHANPIPDLAGMYATFKGSCERARVAVTSAWRAVETKPFSFDAPERVAGEKARHDALIREYELVTSRSMDLRKMSRAFADGAELVDGVHPPARRYTGGTHGTLGVNPFLEGNMLMGHASARFAESRRPASAPPQTITEKLSKSSAPPAAMTKSVKLKALAVQAKLRGQQEAALRAELNQESIGAYNKKCNARFTPLFEDLERTRVPIPLAWQQDSVTAAASARAIAFRAKSTALAKIIQDRVASVADRPLMMLSSSEEAAANAAKVQALVKVAKLSSSMMDRTVRNASSRSALRGNENEGPDEHVALAASG